jgi:putative acetyltransferase
MPLTLDRVDRPTGDARALIEELDAELAVGYEPHQCHGLSIEKLFRPHIAFFIARENGEPVGCGGIAFEDGFAELKRMYVRPSWRGKGVVQAILARLEQEARDRNATRLTLETGDVLHAAMKVYRRAGFTPCPPFGHYKDLPAPTIERSRFFEKRIG